MMNVALIGKMRSGKDTLAEYAVGKYGFTQFAFGDELKRHYHELFGQTETKPRSGYQKIGQFARSIQPDIWVNKCFDNINKLNPKHVIISDLRQPNEYERCFNEGFTFIKVHCNDDVRLKRILEKNDSFDEKDLYHETEMHIDTYEYDYSIENNGTLDDLLKQFDEIMKHEQSNL